MRARERPPKIENARMQVNMCVSRITVCQPITPALYDPATRSPVVQTATETAPLRSDTLDRPRDEKSKVARVRVCARP